MKDVVLSYAPLSVRINLKQTEEEIGWRGVERYRVVRNGLLRGTGGHRQNGREHVGRAKVAGPPGRGLT